MMKKYLVLKLLIFSSFLSAQNSKNEKVSFDVSGNCEMCKMRIEKAALSVKGVKYANWDIPENRMTLTFNSNRVDLIEIHKSIANSGHDTSEVLALDEVYAELPVCCLYIRD